MSVHRWHETWTRLGDAAETVGQWLVVLVALLVLAAVLLAVGTVGTLWLADLIGGWL